MSAIIQWSIFKMSMLSLCLNEANNVIPEELIRECMIASRRYTNNYYPTSTDSFLIDEVFQKRLLPDLNVEYANKLVVPLSKCIVERSNEIDYIVTVPASATNGRKIVTVLGIDTTNIYSNTGALYVNSPGMMGSAILSAGQKLANANQSIPANYEIKCFMISPNSFVVKGLGYLNNSCAVELVIENDDQLNNIPITTASYIKKLFVLATKAYIYKTLKIRVNQAKLDGGAELGAFSEWLDSYSDANELYLEELQYAYRYGILSDQQSKYDWMRTTMSNLI